MDIIDGYVMLHIIIVMYLSWMLISPLFSSGTEKEPGVIPRAVQDVFSYIEEVSVHTRNRVN